MSESYTLLRLACGLETSTGIMIFQVGEDGIMSQKDRDWKRCASHPRSHALIPI